MGKRSKSDSKSVSKKTKKESGFLLNDQVSLLCGEILSNKKYNNLVILLEQYDLAESILLHHEDSKVEATCRKITVELFKTFQNLAENGKMSESSNEKVNLIHKWIKDKYEKFQARLCWFIETKLSYEASIQLDSLDVMLGLVKTESKLGNSFAIEMYQKLVKSLVSSNVGTTLPDESIDNFIIFEFLEKFSKYSDLQFYFFHDNLVNEFKSWNKLDKHQKHKIFANYFTIIKNGLGDSTESFTDLETPQNDQLKENYQNCLIAMMTFKTLTVSEYKVLLVVLHRRVLPYMKNAAGLMDFLTDAYDQEGDEVVPILALNSLWELMKLHNLEYPDFYTKLYSLLTPNILYTKYRLRFFRLVDLFLSSTHLSANLVASFIKKLARLALVASAPGVVIVIPFIYNLLKRHPTCMVMLQNETPLTEYQDNYDNNEKDPLKTKALSSSLWELETLMSHYHPNIATLARLFKEPFRKPSYNMEDFLDWSYISLLDSEKTRKYRGLAALEYEEWDGLYGGFVKGWSL